MRRIEEPFCPAGRPAVVRAVTLSLSLIGGLLAVVGGMIVLFGALAVLIGMMPVALIVEALGIVALGGGCWLLAWGYHQGHRWAWVGAILTTAPLLGCVAIPFGAEAPAWAAGSWLVAGLAGLVLVLAWLPSSRRLFWGRAWLEIDPTFDN